MSVYIDLTEFPLIEVEHIENDEVVICSPRSFHEARSRRHNEMINHGAGPISEIGTTASASPSRNKQSEGPASPVASSPTSCVARASTSRVARAATRQQTGAISLHMNAALPGCEMCVSDSEPEPEPEARSLDCPVCMGPYEQETTTKCGHVFCKCCITSAVEKKKECPICRTKLGQGDLIRIYLH